MKARAKQARSALTKRRTSGANKVRVKSPATGKDAFDATFDTLRGVLSQFVPELRVQIDEPGEYQLSSQTLKDRIGRPLFVAAVQSRKNYVSYHLMPVYTSPELLKNVSPDLRKRMQGKSCFTFRTIDSQQVEELSRLTREGITRFAAIKLPWD
jgi:hypothetical protein